MIIIKPNPIRTNFLFEKMKEVDDLIERAIKNYNQVNDQYVLLKNELFSTDEELENVFFMKSSLQDFISALQDKKEIIYRNLEKELNIEVDGFKSSLDDLEFEIDNLDFI
mgnify:CR=1 FL=1|jgi:hypothetical protein